MLFLPNRLGVKSLNSGIHSFGVLFWGGQGGGYIHELQDIGQRHKHDTWIISYAFIITTFHSVDTTSSFSFRSGI